MIAALPDLLNPSIDRPGRPARLRRAVAVPSSAELAARSEAELIAQVLGGPEPAEEVVRCGSALARLPFWHRRALGAEGLIRDHGVSPSRAVRLAALWELAERWYPDDRPAVETPRDVCLLLDGLRREPAERVVAVLLDARHRLLRLETIAHGTLNASRFIPCDLLAPALSVGAAAVVLEVIWNTQSRSSRAVETVDVVDNSGLSERSAPSRTVATFRLSRRWKARCQQRPLTFAGGHASPESARLSRGSESRRTSVWHRAPRRPTREAWRITSRPASS